MHVWLETFMTKPQSAQNLITIWKEGTLHTRNDEPHHCTHARNAIARRWVRTWRHGSSLCAATRFVVCGQGVAVAAATVGETRRTRGALMCTNENNVHNICRLKRVHARCVCV